MEWATMPPFSPTFRKASIGNNRPAYGSVHFDLTYVPLKHLGYKSAVVNFSDIYAMNGTPGRLRYLLAFPSVSA